MTRLGHRIVLLVVALALVVASCGGTPASSPESASPAKRLLDRAARLVASARSVRVTGHVSILGSPAIVALVAYGNGDLKGSVALSAGTFEVIQIGTTDYVRASANLLMAEVKVPLSVAQHYARDWISVPSSTASTIAAGVSLHAIATTLSRPSTHVREIWRSTSDREQPVGLESSAGITVWVARSGSPYPVKATGELNGSHATVRFSGWNSFANPSAPRVSIPLSSLAP